MTRLTIGLGIAAVISTLLCTVACGGSDGSLAKGGMNMVVMSGQARVQSAGGNTLIVEGQEAAIAADDQITADEADVKLLLANGSLLHLSPDTELQLVTFSAEGTVRLRLSQPKGRLEVEAASPLLIVEVFIEVSERFVTKRIQFTATPAVRDTTFQLWIDGPNAHLTVEAGEVNVANDDRTATISAGSEVKAIPGGELIVSQIGAPVIPTAVAAATTDLIPTTTPDLPQPSPTVTATLIVVSNYPYLAPGLVGPADGSKFKADETILLIWDTPTPLSEDEWYEVQLWGEGEVPYRIVQWVKEGTWRVKPQYYPGRYQWRILIVRGREDHKETDLSPPSQTWSFGWLRPSVPTSTAPTSTPASGAPAVTVYMLGTNNAQGFATFSGEHVDAGRIYTEGSTIYGNVAVRIRDKVYHSDEELSPEPKQLPDPWRVEFEFDQLLVARTGSQAGFNPKKAQFWVGTLSADSAVGEDSPYSLTMKLYEGNKLWKSIQVFFAVEDAPESPGSGGDDIEIPPTRPL